MFLSELRNPRDFFQRPNHKWGIRLRPGLRRCLHFFGPLWSWGRCQTSALPQMTHWLMTSMTHLYILYIYSIYTLYILYIYSIYTLYILYIYSIYTLYILYIYSIYTLYILYIYSIYILYIYSIYTLYILYIYICIIFESPNEWLQYKTSFFENMCLLLGGRSCLPISACAALTFVTWLTGP